MQKIEHLQEQNLFFYSYSAIVARRMFFPSNIEYWVDSGYYPIKFVLGSVWLKTDREYFYL